MKFEVAEQDGAWVVRRNGAELARFADQQSAMNDVSERLGGLSAENSVSLKMRYQARD